ncbi:MAG TPA: Uma2 family endonuclease [Planctomycetaceae bacterium]|nr:Uma2 family endonuclease [Planctomycetaceae bacterium]HQZ64759.1 Uma2 family endonuclease [Planctomycetaceae bacterium]
MSINSVDLLVGTPKAGEPAWRIALFYPEQGGWTETDYLNLDGGPLVEFDSGFVEVLDLPTKEHQRIVQFLFLLLREFVLSHQIGEAFVAPLPVRLSPGKFREPDIVFVDTARGEYKGVPDGADLVVEVVSASSDGRRRDTQTKVSEYAAAGISEYWIVDPEQGTVTVHHLVDGTYSSALVFRRGDVALSVRLPAFTVSVDDVLNSARG